MKSTSVRILIADYVPAFNKGELAILEGILESFQVLDKTDVSIFSFNREIDSIRFPKSVRLVDAKKQLYMLKGSQGFEDYHKANMINGLLAGFQHLIFGFVYFVLKENALKLMTSGIWKEYRNADVIITSHDQESCLFGPARLPLLPLYVTLLAKTLHKPIVIYGNGTYKFRRKLWEKLARFVLDNVDLVTTREKETFDYFQRIAARKSNIFLTADLAFLLKPIARERTLQILQKEGVILGKGLLIGVTITNENLSFGTGINGNLAKKQEAIIAFADLIDRLIDDFGATAIFIPHCVGPGNFVDDRPLARKIYSLIRNKQHAFLLTKEYSPRELRGIVGVLDFLIGGRVHSVISAISLSVPAIVLTKPKDARALSIVGGMVESEWIYEIREPSFVGLSSKIRNLLSVRHEISEDLYRKSQIARELALKNGKLLKALLKTRN